MPTYRDRFYSSPPQTHNVATQYLWDASIIMSGASGIQTGAWRPLYNTDLGGGGGGGGFAQVGITGVALDYLSSGFFTSSINIITGGQIEIPVGAKSYSVAVESGNAFINNNLFISPISYDGGGYDKFSLSTSINVGCTGGRVIVIWEI